jgi:hexosaminidase
MVSGGASLPQGAGQTPLDPGWCVAAYPQFSSTGGPFQVTTGALWPITDIFCAGNESTFRFLQDVLTEVMDLFPGKYIHIGGDKADKTNWKKCPPCQARMKQEGLADSPRKRRSCRGVE